MAIFASVQLAENVSLFNLATFIPAIAAFILVYREGKSGAIKALLKHVFDHRQIKPKAYYFPILLLYPAIVFVQYGFAYIFGNYATPPHFSVTIPIIFVILFIAATGEELGWMGYLFDTMEDRFGSLYAAVLMGLIWAGFHIPLFTSSGASISWIAWQLAYIVVTRIIFVWIFCSSGRSVFAISVMHATFNLGWQFFPPAAGLLVPSFYDPRSLALSALAVFTIVLLFRGPSLTKYRFKNSRSPEK